MYLFKNPMGLFVMGDSKESVQKAGSFKILYNSDTETILIIDNAINHPADWSKSISPTTIKKADGTYYKNYSGLISAVPGFFQDAPAVNGSEVILTNEITGIKTRFIATETGYRIDVTLTELGFEGTESQDNGETGDWVTTTSA